MTIIIFVEFGERIFQQTIGIPVGTNCAPLLVDLFLYSHEVAWAVKEKEKKLAQSFNYSFRYIDDVI